MEVTAILWFHVVVVKFVHDDLSEIQYSLTKVNRFVHHYFDFAHVATHEVFTKENT